LKENFDRFNFEIYKEKEMADFRRWFTVLAVLTLFVGLASAQVGTGSSSTGAPFTCAVQNVTVTPQLRSEGFTEQTGDIVLVCTGGAPLATGTVIPTVNVTVYYNVPAVTSRLLSTSPVNASEALLLIDEPNNGQVGSQSGYGPMLPQTLCANPANGAGPNGCPQVVGNVTIGGVVYSGVPVLAGATTTPGPNVYQGVVAGSSVTFNGIPVLPPVTSGYSRVYRITNVRVNANGVGGGVAGGPGQVNASISISGATSLPISNPNPIVGYINQGLNSSVTGAGSFTQCNSQGGAFAGLLNFKETFPTAFKTRVDGTKAGKTNNWDGTGTQNVPSYAYNSESNFVANGAGGNGSVTGGGFTAGLADYGTRLKAVFSNVPAGATIYVSTTNVTSTNGASAGVNPVVNPASSTTATSYATLLIAGAEGTNDNNGVPSATYTNTFTSASTSGNASSAVQYVAMTSQGNPMVAVWEVLNTQPTYQETISFSVFVAYTATSTFPPAGSSQVAFSFAANPTNGAFSASNASTINAPIPRFADTSGQTGNPIGTFFTINLCQTTLLFPYVTTVTGFDTGISIANTTTDPFKTLAQQGTCTLYWYQGANNPPNTVTGVVASGTVLPLAASATTNAGANFTGYMIAVCNFQLAHGFAVVTDYGAQKILSVYLALVVPTGVNNRNGYSSTAPEALNN